MEIDPSCKNLIADLGRDLGLTDLAFDTEGKVVFKIGEHRMLTIAVRPKTNSLVFHTKVADRAADSFELLKLALEGNFVWTRTSGATLALDPSTGALVAHHEIASTGTEFPQFITALEEFVNAVEAWSLLIERLRKRPRRKQASHLPDMAQRVRMHV